MSFCRKVGGMWPRAGLMALVIVLLLLGSMSPSLGELRGQSTTLPSVIDIFNNEQNVTIFGATPTARYGICCPITGDFNGDGVKDIAIHQYIIFGKTTWPVTIDLAATPTPVDATLIGGEVIVSGDVDGDGFDDLIIGGSGAPGVNGPGGNRPNAGAVSILFGRAIWPTSVDPYLSVTAPDVTIYGADAGDSVGLAFHKVAVTGDVNGDGFDDLIIGAPGGDGPSNTRPAAGEGYIILGRARDTWPTIIDTCTQSNCTDPALRVAGSDTPNIILFGAEMNDQFAAHTFLMKTGDVNSDGLDDILISAGMAAGPQNSRSLAGEAYVIFGRASFPAVIDTCTQDNCLGSSVAGSSPPDIIIFGADPEDFLGVESIASGDIDNDGFDDILISAHFADGPQNSRVSGGEVYVIFGRERSAWPGIIDACMQINCGNPASRVVGSEDPDIILFAAEAYDIPDVVASGDVNNDGFDDILMALFTAAGPGNSRSRAGEAFVIFGRASNTWPTVIDTCMQINCADPASKVPGSDAPDITIFGAEPDDNLFFVQSGDVNGDGIDDILAGAFGANGPDNGRANAGEIYLIFGR